MRAATVARGRDRSRRLRSLAVERRDLSHPLVPTLAAALLGVAYLIAAPDTADMAAHTYRTWLGTRSASPPGTRSGTAATTWPATRCSSRRSRRWRARGWSGSSPRSPPSPCSRCPRAGWRRRRRAARARDLAVPRRRDEQRRDRADAVHARDRARGRGLGLRAPLARCGAAVLSLASAWASPRDGRVPRRRGARDRRGRRRAGAEDRRAPVDGARARRCRPIAGGAADGRRCSPRAASTTSSATAFWPMLLVCLGALLLVDPTPARRDLGAATLRRRAASPRSRSRTRSARTRCGRRRRARPGAAGRCSRARARRAPRSPSIAVALLYLQWLPAVRAVEEARGDPSTNAGASTRRCCASCAPRARAGRAARGPAHAQPLGGGVPRARLPARARLAPPARPQGQPALLRQRHPLTAARYERWLRDNAVRWVALPTAPLDFSAQRREGAAARRPAVTCEPVYTSADWRIWEVRGAEPPVSGRGASDRGRRRRVRPRGERPGGARAPAPDARTGRCAQGGRLRVARTAARAGRSSTCGMPGCCACARASRRAAALRREPRCTRPSARQPASCGQPPCHSSR